MKIIPQTRTKAIKKCPIERTRGNATSKPNNDTKHKYPYLNKENNL